MKREVQVKESKSLIVDAFLCLLKEKSYDEITLAEIAEKAGVSRMTIHRHFKSKENIIIYQAKTLVAKINNNRNGEIQTLEEDILNRFTIFKSLPHVKLIIHSDKFPSIIYDKVDAAKIRSKMALVDKYFEVLPDKYMQQFVIGGVSHMVKEWVKNDFDQTPQEMTRKVMKIFKIIQSY